MKDIVMWCFGISIPLMIFFGHKSGSQATHWEDRQMHAIFFFLSAIPFFAALLILAYHAVVLTWGSL